MADTNKLPDMIAVVMAGGRGTRFWPRSRGRRPKQFLAMIGEKTLLHQTVERLEPSFENRNIYIVTTEDLAAETRRMLPQLPAENVLVEPEGRNTAPCLALALTVIERRSPEGVMVVLSADHWIGDEALFLDDIRPPSMRPARMSWSPSASAPPIPRRDTATSRPRAREPFSA